ncbi:hypothetical protein KR026_006249 [Drosophila bipectinata]|nr:hypothetical protein KR026_006249 [Drosophila bipectinata]
MCGIFCTISLNSQINFWKMYNSLKLSMKKRGPDAHNEILLNHDAGLIFFAGFVLWQQGANLEKQPVVKNDFIILFNGDLYNIQKSVSMSDTTWLANRISECYTHEDLVSLVKVLQGPFCLIIYNKRNQMLYFARDTLGRNSLIIERHHSGLNLLSTSRHYVTEQITSIELPPLGLYQLRVNDLSSCVLYPWQPINEYTGHLIQVVDLALNWKTEVKKSISPSWLLGNETPLNYSFYNYEYIDNFKTLCDNMIIQPQIKIALDKLDKLLCASVDARIKSKPPFCSICLKHKSNECRHAKICILFSGGIDCTILALISHKLLPIEEPIELINVAFEYNLKTSNLEQAWNVPDRKTCLKSVDELKRICPGRCWTLLEVNVTRLELARILSSHIKNLIYPLQKILDESLGCAFWFASHSSSSTSRVAIIGSGADELFGGYTRHRNSYIRCHGEESIRHNAVKRELDVDWQRLPARNLARDDRVIADNGKTARAPFLEENFVAFVRSLEPYQKCCFTLPEGIGDKLLLRLYGYRMGLKEVAFFKKKAIQFGSRIANKNRNASENSDNLIFT